MPLSRDMSLDPADVFPLAFMMYFLYGAMALPAGYISDHWSRFVALRICLLGMGVSSIAAGMAQDINSLTISLASIGMFCGLYHPAGLGLIAHEIERQGSAHGINGVFGNLGIAAAPFFTGIILFFGDWRTVFFSVALLGFGGFAITYIFAIKETPRAEEGQKRDISDSGHPWKYFIILCAGMTMAGLVYRANMTALPSYFEIRAVDILNAIKPFTSYSENADALSGASALLISTLFLFSMMGQIVGGKLADKIDLRWGYLMFHAASLPFALLMAMFYGIPLYIVAAGMVFFNLGMQPLENSLVSRLIPRKWVSTGYGIKFTLTFGVGSIAVYEVAGFKAGAGLPWLYYSLSIQILILVAIAGTLLFVSRQVARIANMKPGQAQGI